MDMWSFFWALVAFFLALAVYFHLKKSSRITNATTSSQPEPSTEQQSSAPSSSNTPVSVEYEVFLSFRGPDVRTNFADFLHKYLVHTKIRTFLDNEDLRKGEKMAPSLVKAIKESKVYIPILSPDYASSKWCLQELSQMVKCCKQGNGHIILPIFYMMAPRDVRHQEGSYKKAFRQHMKKFDAETINEWKEALKEVGEMKGWSVKESDGQGAVIDQVFSKVWSHLTRDYMLVTDDLIGIDLHVENMKGLLQLPKYETVKVIGIHGMGGIGKTTVAKALYNEVCAQFERFCFLEDVRETLVKPDGVVTLQKRIISSILRVDVDIKDANEGINVIRNRICKLKVFVVLDDADDRFKFDEILGKLEDFCLGSRFIITTKINKQDKKNVFWIHDHTRDLGRTIVCEEDFRCPWKRSRIWSNEDALDMLTYEQGTDRVEVLKVDIEDDNFKLTERQFEKLSGLRYLNVNKGEFTGNFERIIPNLRWLELYGWRWLPDDMNLKKLVILRMSYTALFDDWKGWNSIKVAQKLKSISLVCCRSLRRPPNLSQCQNLEIIHFSGCKRMRGELSIDSLKNLKELYLGWSPITAITGDIGMLQKLQVFNMINLDLRELPAELKQVPALPASLKWLHLSSPCIPNLLDLKNLQVLDFAECCPEIPGEIWKLSKLKTLRLYACACKAQLLEDSGNEISALPSSLSSLELNLCNNLEILPNLSNLINLKEFILVGTNVHEIPGLGGMRMLETLKISHSPHITHLDGLEHFILLKTLSVSCDKLEKLPSLMNLTKLDTLEITHCHLISEIHGLGNLRESLSCLTIKNCPSLAYTEGLGLLKLSATMEQLLPSLSNLGKLRKLILGLDQNDDGNILSREQFLDFSALCNLNILYISSAERLTEVCGFERLELLESLDISHCSEIRKLPNLSGLKKLKKLDILGCMQLSEVMGLENLESLQELRICNCTSIKKLPDLSCLKQLQSLDTSGCTQLTEVTGIEKLKKLKWLNRQEFKGNAI
ncbi:Disease resistance protein L6 [Linum perenne]